MSPEEASVAIARETDRKLEEWNRAMRDQDAKDKQEREKRNND
jgi:hypothetical protein